MKKLSLLFVMLLAGIFTYAQDFFYDFSSTTNGGTGWTYVTNGQVSGTSYVSPFILNPTNLTNLTATGVTGVRDVRIYRNLNGIAGDHFLLEFRYSFTFSSTNNGFCFLPAVLTAGNNAPLTLDNTTSGQTNQDMIGVVCVTPHTANSQAILKVVVKDGTTPQSLCSTNITPGTEYIVRVERFGHNSGKFTVFPSSGLPEDGFSCCLNWTGDVNGLNHLQIAQAPEADSDRSGNAIIDNLRLTTKSALNECCAAPYISGPSLVCSTSQTAQFCVNGGNNNTSFMWLIPAGIQVTGANTNCITVTSWGNRSGVITFGVSWMCNCVQQDPLTIQVVVHPDIAQTNADFAGSIPTPINYLPNFTLTASNTTTPAGATHYWNIFEAANGVSGDFTILNETTTPVELRPVGTGTSYTIQTAASGSYLALDPSKFYIIQHKVFYTDGNCPGKEARRKVLSQKSAGGNSFDYSPSVIFEGTSDEAQISKSIENVSIFPNPAQDFLTIEIPVEKINNITVYNQLGEVVLIQDVESTDNVLTLNIAELKSGAYVVSFIGQNYSSNTRFVKK